MFMKMRNGTIACEFSVRPDFSFVSHVPCEYDRDTVRYALTRFVKHCGKFQRESALESWHFRIKKGKAKKNSHTYLIPAPLMELPGEWAAVYYSIDATGAEVWKVELFDELPYFVS